MRDWRKIMEDFGLYEESRHMKTEQMYTYPSGSYIEFFSVDNALKVRGPGRDIVFVNECNLIEYDTLRQLMLRTKQCAIIDYNPADEFHWIYDKVITRKNCKFVQTTYLDNPFLTPETVQEIESYKETDENFWRIYGLGERGHSEGIVYTHWQVVTKIPTGKTFYGLDFGYIRPSALVRVTECDKGLYVEEIFYQSHLTNEDIISRIKDNVGRYDEIWADSEDPKTIDYIRKAGVNIKNVKKGPGSVRTGIDFIKSRKLFISSDAINTMKEIKSYKFNPKNKVEEPKKENDHAMDAMRYAAIQFRQVRTYNSPMIIK